jgi:hypothetical protein
VARAFRHRVLPCGAEPVLRLEAAVEEKLVTVRALEAARPDEFTEGFDRLVRGVVSARPYRSRIVEANPAERIQEILRETREGRLGAPNLPAVAERLAGASEGVRLDLASELLHSAAPDRIALLARWVWNPARRTGILGEFGGPPPASYAGMQTRLGEIRLELEALGFRSRTFAGVDVLLALTYAARLEEATDRSLRGGGIESLLPGSFSLATMVLGVRRRLAETDADR